MANKVNLQKIKSEMIVSISFRKFMIVSIIFRKFISSRRRTIVN